MIKGTFGGLGQFNYVIYCGVVVAVLVEQLPGGGNDTALCLIGNFFHLFLHFNIIIIISSDFSLIEIR